MSDESQDAKYLVNNPAFVKALDTARQQAMTAALGCDVKDDEGRRRYLDAVRTVDKVRTHIHSLAHAPESPVEVEDIYQERAKARFSALFKR